MVKAASCRVVYSNSSEIRVISWTGRLGISGRWNQCHSCKMVFAFQNGATFKGVWVNCVWSYSIPVIGVRPFFWKRNKEQIESIFYPLCYSAVYRMQRIWRNWDNCNVITCMHSGFHLMEVNIRTKVTVKPVNWLKVDLFSMFRYSMFTHAHICIFRYLER